MKKKLLGVVSFLMATILTVSTVGFSSIQAFAAESNAAGGKVLKFTNRWNQSDIVENVITFEGQYREYCYELDKAVNTKDVEAVIVKVSEQQGELWLKLYDYNYEKDEFVEKTKLEHCFGKNEYKIVPTYEGSIKYIGFLATDNNYPFTVTVDSITVKKKVNPDEDPSSNDSVPESPEQVSPSPAPASPVPVSPSPVPASPVPASPEAAQPSQEQHTPAQQKEQPKQSENTEQANTAIAKKANTLKVTAKTVNAAAGKKVTFKVSKVLKVSKAIGKVSYKKLSGNKKITIDSKTGKVTVKKGLKKGTYKVKVKVKAAGNNDYNNSEKTVTFKVKVK